MIIYIFTCLNKSIILGCSLDFLFSLHTIIQIDYMIKSNKQWKNTWLLIINYTKNTIRFSLSLFFFFISFIFRMHLSWQLIKSDIPWRCIFFCCSQETLQIERLNTCQHLQLYQLMTSRIWICTQDLSILEGIPFFRREQTQKKSMKLNENLQ